eukprot:s2397_g11.t1
MLAHSENASAMIWEAMGMWETLSVTPTALKDLRVVFNPKTGKERNFQITAKGPFGLPQGDGASPLVLGLLLSLGHLRVQCLAGEKKVYQLIYTDDRTVITNNEATLCQALDVWKDFSRQFHLLENEDKLQICTLHDGDAKHLEVLGGLIGSVTKKQLHEHKKGRKGSNKRKR